MTMRSVITGTGSYIPPVRVPNDAFVERDFRTADGKPLGKMQQSTRPRQRMGAERR